MTEIYILTILTSFASAFLATALALFAWQRRATGWSRPFSVVMLSLAGWALAYSMELGTTDLMMKLLWNRLQYIGIVITPVAWFEFAARYTSMGLWLRATYRRLLYVVPFTTILFVFTSSSHELIWRRIELQPIAPGINILKLSYGPWFWVHAVFSYLLLLAGSLCFVQSARRVQGQYKWHMLALVVGSGIPWLGNIMYVFRLGPLPYFDWTPLTFIVGGVILTWVVLRQQLFDLVPVARQTVLSSMPDGVLVINAQGRIVDINPAAEVILGNTSSNIIGRGVVEVMPQWARFWQDAIEGDEVETEISVTVGAEERYFDLRISPVYGSHNSVTGRLIMLRDITQRKETEAELRGRQQLFENLVAVARATSEGPSLQATLQNALDITAGLTEAEYGSLFLLDSDNRVTHSILARGKTAPGSQREIIGTVMDQGLAGWVLRHREPALIQDTLDDERWLTLPNQPYAVRSVLVTPITSGSEAPGILTLQHSKPNHFTSEDETLLRAASDQMALALHNAQIYEEQRRLADRQITLYEALRTIGEHLEPGTVLHLAVDTIAKLTGWPALAILVPSSNNQSLVAEAATGLLRETLDVSFPIAKGNCGLVFASGKTRITMDAPSKSAQSTDFPQLNSALFVPLRHGQQRLGVFVVESAEPAAFTDDDIWLAESLAEAVGLAMANARLFKAVADEHSRLQALIESSRDGIILIGTNRHILVINRTALAYLDMPGDPEDWMYCPLSEVVDRLPQDTVDAFKAALEEPQSVNEGNQDASEGEVEILARALRWLNLPVQTGETALGRLLVLQDVTKERALQRMRDDLTHTMVHDLRNPLNIVSSSLEMLQQRLEPEAMADISQMIRIARESTQRMLGLINGILNISRLESGRMPLNCTDLDMRQLVEQVLEAQAPLAREKQLHLEAASGRQGTIILADAELIERVLQNLLGNAIKFTPQGGRIRVLLDGDPSTLHVAVSDTGPGVPSEIQDQLFEKFVTGAQKGRGSGLGLAFCRMAVEAHGGQIWVESTPGHGATFYFTLPYVNDDAQEVMLL